MDHNNKVVTYDDLIADHVQAIEDGLSGATKPCGSCGTPVQVPTELRHLDITVYCDSNCFYQGEL